MKKNIIYIASLFIAILFLNSCSDSFLDSTPSTKVPEEGAYTRETIESALTAAYLPLQWFDLWTPLPFIAEAMGDDIRVGGGNTSDQLGMHNISRYKATAIDQSTAIWSACYYGIFRCNIVLKYAPTMDMDESTKNRLVADAYALRTYYYFQVWRFYGNVPYFENNPTDIVNEWKDLKQFSVDEIYEKLIVDIDKAIDSNALPDRQTSAQGHFTKAAAKMLKAHIVLMKEDQTKYVEVINDMNSIITSGEYQLVDDYASIWEDEGEWGSESIFEINYSDIGSSRGWGDDNRKPGGTVFPTMIGINGLNDTINKIYSSGWGFMPIEKHLYDLYDDNDQRKNASILSFDYYKKTENMKATYDTTRWDNTGYFNKKYLPRYGGNSNAPTGQGDLNYRNNLRVFRLSDTYLIASELLVRTGGNQALANEYLNKVRGRAYRYTGNYQETATLDNLLAERRLEFACEGHRFFDLVRFGKATSIHKMMQVGWENVGTGRIRTYAEFSYTPASRYFPIPQSEVDRSQGALKQNTGY